MLRGCVDVWMCGCVDVWMCGCVDVWMCGCVDVWMCGVCVVSGEAGSSVRKNWLNFVNYLTMMAVELK